MKRRRLPVERLLVPCLLAALVAGHFSVHDDIHAYPQYRVALADSSISAQTADHLLSSSSDDKSYHLMKWNSSTFVCSLPHFRPPSAIEDETTALTKAEEEKERLRARKKGWELLRPLEGNCMYYNTGWWTYAFCHNRYVKQFHALPPGNNVPHYPPVQDPSTESFMLGQTPTYERHQDTEIYGQPPSQLDEGLTSVDALGEQRYLVQKMGAGTWCDLIKKNRRIEVQFQCDPNGGDRIEWIKETTTCSYLMVIHTAKLCNDLAFVPVKRVGEGEGIHEILCSQVVGQDEIGAGNGFQDGSQQIFELPPGTKPVEDAKGPTSPETTTVEENPEAADYLEFILPPAPLPSAAKLLQETIQIQIKEGSFLRPDGEPYDPESEDIIEYRVELIDDEQDTVFGVIKVKISQGAVVETDFSMNAEDGEQGKDVLPESLRKELNDWLQGRDVGPPENR